MPREPRPPRRPRLDDVAALVGVSPASVSLVLRNADGPSAETRRRVLEAARQLGYRPDRTASLLARRRSHLLGVLIDVRNSFHAQVVEHLHAAAEQVGYDLVLSTTTGTRSERRAVETLLDSRCEALILLGPAASGLELAALGDQVPVVVLGRRAATSPGLDVVRSSDGDGVALAVDHLVDLSHRAIAFVDGGKGTIAADRRRGYRTAMRRRGFAEQTRIITGDSTEEAGIRAVHAILEGGDLPTAITAFNDRSAVGVLDALNRAGVGVPGTVSVVGYDDSPEAQLAHISLTTVNQDAENQAMRAVAAAVGRLDGGRIDGEEAVLAPHLVVRATTGPSPVRS